jgi:hypothetical protein
MGATLTAGCAVAFIAFRFHVHWAGFAGTQPPSLHKQDTLSS